MGINTEWKQHKFFIPKEYVAQIISPSYKLDSLEGLIDKAGKISNTSVFNANPGVTPNVDSEEQLKSMLENYSNFKKIYPTLVSANPSVIKFLKEMLTDADMIEILKDNEKHFTHSNIKRFTEEEKHSLLSIVTAVGALKICEQLISDYKIEPEIAESTIAFLSKSLPLMEKYVKYNPPIIEQALNFTAFTSDLPALIHLINTYKRNDSLHNALNNGTSNFLATAAYHNTNEANNYITGALENGAKPTTLSFEAAVDKENVVALTLFAHNNPGLFEQKYNDFMEKSRSNILKSTIEILKFEMEFKDDALSKPSGPVNS